MAKIFKLEVGDVERRHLTPMNAHVQSPSVVKRKLNILFTVRSIASKWLYGSEWLALISRALENEYTLRSNKYGKFYISKMNCIKMHGHHFRRHRPPFHRHSLGRRRRRKILIKFRAMYTKKVENSLLFNRFDQKCLCQLMQYRLFGDSFDRAKRCHSLHRFSFKRRFKIRDLG